MLEQPDKEWIEARYVKKDDCNEKQTSINGKFANDDARIKLVDQRLGTWDKLLWAIALSTIGSLFTSIINMLGGFQP